MIDKESGRPGRPRSFDLEEALEAGQQLFHERGYDGVSLSDLTAAIGIAAPSFYAAFGSKAAFFQMILGRYSSATPPIDAFGVEGDAVATLIETYLVARAVSYSRDAAAQGCLVLNATRNCSDAGAAAAAGQIAEDGRLRVRDLVARSRPDLAEPVSDLVASVMQGLSAHARQGWSTERLVTVARNAALSVRTMAETSDFSASEPKA
ncbi:TetR family transcriptional regulator [Skermanella stibiiresistens SB22]|uniref:TetR family transcriptional regulator n=1 Tax=Skermanella stibiiresistens SB22 TaxID=1385369 RepID=W9HAI6_9PROT|nr:TetR/AcrR family transcriptional regulator [Skermanella stibiiresistens]EWY41751.1 TetR family transcriptional regulator [Skermanella stibiiresistens SB22]